MELPSEKIAQLARENNPQVCCFPINGTRRWYLFEGKQGENYLEKVARRHVEVYRMLFNHGLTTLLAPVFGSELLDRGPEYLKLAAEGMAWLATEPLFLDFYQEFGVRVHFYGDYRKQLAATPYAYLSELFDEVTQKTSRNSRYRIFFGVFAGNAASTVAEYSVRYYSKNNSVPAEHLIEEMYYGEYIGPVSLFIGFDKFWVFDMPLLSTENTNLYFTVSPSLYLNERQLRSILYDHLYTRSAPEPDYETLSPQAKQRMQDFYKANADNIHGLGILHDGIWFPRQKLEAIG